jgi:hypothetical protein
MLVDALAVSPGALVEGAGVTAVLSAAESGFGEQAVNTTRLIRIADSFAGEGSLVIKRLGGKDGSE